MAPMYSVFVKDLQNKSICLAVGPWYSLQDVKQLLQGRVGIPVAEQVLTFRTRTSGNVALVDLGITQDSTLHLTGRLRGGKGGFGSLLRSAGRKSLTDNDDACRDLSGRRVRLVNAEKKLKDWAATEKTRQLQKQTAQEERKRAKAERRAESSHVDIEAAKKEQGAALSSVAKALDNSLRAGLKRPMVPAAKPAAKKPRYSSDSDSDLSDNEDSDSEGGIKPVAVPATRKVVAAPAVTV